MRIEGRNPGRYWSHWRLGCAPPSQREVCLSRYYQILPDRHVPYIRNSMSRSTSCRFSHRHNRGCWGTLMLHVGYLNM
ncbi:hypothetical protein DPMN_154383 [Dreissena polymorpha]|uniref:Uncharacterized protein n=1 Tax=Dreissena polymorpha TaxID=45954 RepID=A0A9D4FLW2_DREPO|nr:hypothetical protein DPMN_154383 [Dreissena polymorpha]